MKFSDGVDRDIGLDLYTKVLNVPRFSDLSIIKKTYRKEIRKYHPDHFTSNLSEEEKARCVARSIALNTAMEVMRDETLRQEYDTKLSETIDAVNRGASSSTNSGVSNPAPTPAAAAAADTTTATAATPKASSSASSDKSDVEEDEQSSKRRDGKFEYFTGYYPLAESYYV